MIYVLGNTTATYEFHHSEIDLGVGLADGLQAAGAEVVVAWGGVAGELRGLRHVNWREVRPGVGDVLFVTNPHLGATVASGDPRFEHLCVAGELWLYTSCAHSGCEVAWRRFDRIFVENSAQVPVVQRFLPHARVDWCMTGAPHEVEVLLEDPYPAEVRRPLFFAGRIGEPEVFRGVLEHLPPEYEAWVVSPAVVVPEGWRDGSGGELLCSLAGRTMLVRLRPGDGHSTTADDDRHVWVDPFVAREVMAVVLGTPRAHFLGSLPYGTFWHFHRRAWCSLDFGFPRPPPGPNCKVVDVLRAGGRVVADGESSSFYLLEKHGAGVVVPYRDHAAYARAIAALPEEDDQARATRAARYRDEESWRARARVILGQR